MKDFSLRRRVCDLFVTLVFVTAALAYIELPFTTAAEIPSPATSGAAPAAVLRADVALDQALSKPDKAALGRLLDPEFTWTDAFGKTSTKSQFLQAVGTANAAKPAFSGGNPSGQQKEYAYGQVVVVQADNGRMHVLRVWVKRPNGWRALVYQEVQSLDAPPTVTPGPGTVCDNPCKQVPFTPKNAAEKGVIESYMGLESAAVAHSATDWAAHAADEFAAASSNSDAMLDKPTRVQGLEREKMAGVSPTPLVSGRMFDFGNAVVMISLHKPDRGKPLHITRVWIKRDGKWLETLSYQTAIQDSLARR